VKNATAELAKMNRSIGEATDNYRKQRQYVTFSTFMFLFSLTVIRTGTGVII